MYINPFKNLYLKSALSLVNFNPCRYLRRIGPSAVGPKVIEGKIKTVRNETDDYTGKLESYKDFIKSLKKSKLGSELEVEKQFLNDDFYGHVTERCDAFHDMHVSEERSRRSQIKKAIIGRKYFKLEKETNLLTHAAKEQIRYLHKINPSEWNCKTLSECFPISEAGVKKLLKCNFVLTCPEKIKLHDADVAKKWEILKSGKPTNKIFPLTQKLFKEGKLVDDYFSGNPNLPAVKPPVKKIIKMEEPKEVGEFSAIVKTYFDYQKQKLLESGKENSSEKHLSLRDAVKSEKINKKVINKFKYSDVEHDDDDDDENSNPEVYPSPKRKYKYLGEIPFSQFKEILKEETSSKSKYKNEYDDFVMQETTIKENTASKVPQDTQNCFMKIPKYKNENVKLMYENNRNVNVVYQYDDNLGYQYPTGKNITGKIKVSPKQYNNKKIYKDGSVYDSDGNFLYRIP